MFTNRLSLPTRPISSGTTMTTLTRLGFAALTLLASQLVNAHEYTAGELRIDHPWTRATPPGAKNGAAYFKITNSGEADELLAASGPDLAQRVELHVHLHENGAMLMRQVAKVDVPAKGEVAFKPMGYHVMLIGLKKPLQAGEKLPLTLKFRKTGDVKIELKVEALDATAATMGMH